MSESPRVPALSLRVCPCFCVPGGLCHRVSGSAGAGESGCLREHAAGPAPGWGKRGRGARGERGAPSPASAPPPAAPPQREGGRGDPLTDPRVLNGLSGGNGRRGWAISRRGGAAPVSRSLFRGPGRGGSSSVSGKRACAAERSPPPCGCTGDSSYRAGRAAGAPTRYHLLRGTHGH